jgi:hypothetical protein
MDEVPLQGFQRFLLHENVHQLPRLRLQEAQVLPCCGILQLSKKRLCPILQKRIKFVVQAVQDLEVLGDNRQY